MKCFDKSESSLVNPRDDDIHIPPIQWTDPHGNFKKNTDPLSLCRNILRKLCSMEEGKKEEHSSCNERLKNREKTAREGLKNIPIPDLIVVGGNANVVVWIETVRRKFDEVKNMVRLP